MTEFEAEGLASSVWAFGAPLRWTTSISPWAVTIIAHKDGWNAMSGKMVLRALMTLAEVVVVSVWTLCSKKSKLLYTSRYVLPLNSNRSESTFSHRWFGSGEWIIGCLWGTLALAQAGEALTMCSTYWETPDHQTNEDTLKRQCLDVRRGSSEVFPFACSVVAWCGVHGVVGHHEGKERLPTCTPLTGQYRKCLSWCGLCWAIHACRKWTVENKCCPAAVWSGTPEGSPHLLVSRRQGHAWMTLSVHLSGRSDWGTGKCQLCVTAFQAHDNGMVKSHETDLESQDLWWFWVE